MGHYFESGFSVQEPMWHGLGVVLDDYPTDPKEAQRLAGLDWQVKKQPVRILREDVEIENIADEVFRTAAAKAPGADERRAQVREQLTLDRLGVETSPQFWATYRDDNYRTLGIVTDRYTIVQNLEMFEFMQALLGQDERVEFVTAGSLREGVNPWVLAKLPEHKITIPGTDDETLPYILITTGHDGWTSFKAKATGIRTVCWNTLNLALHDGEPIWRISHVGDPMARVDEARAVLGLTIDWAKAFQQVADQLAQIAMTEAQVDAFTEHMFPLATTSSTTMATRVQTERDGFKSLYRIQHELNGANLTKIKGTRWAALQTATQWADWCTRAKTPEYRLERSLFFPTDEFKKRAFKTLTVEDLDDALMIG